jgi:hypothetical protein
MRKIVVVLMGVLVCSSAALGAFDFTISGGYHGIKILEGSESLLMTGGGGDGIVARGYSYVEIRGTAPLGQFVGGISTIDLTHNSLMNYYGGETRGLYMYGDARAVIQGGRIDGIRSFQYVPVHNNVAYPHIIIDCQLNSVVYDSQSNVVAGNWKNGDPFSIQLHDQSGYDPVIENIEFIPEPMTLSLFGFGGLVIRGLRKKSSHR